MPTVADFQCIGHDIDDAAIGEDQAPRYGAISTGALAERAAVVDDTPGRSTDFKRAAPG